MATKYYTYVDDEEYEIIVHGDGTVEIEGARFHVNLLHISDKVVYSMLMEGRSHEVFSTQDEEAWRILLDGERYRVVVEDERTKRLKAFTGSDGKLIGDIQVKAPMPGLVVKILVEPGQTVAANDPLVILEAMKMENELRAPRDGIIKEIRVAPGGTVELQAILLILGEVPDA